MSVEIKIIFAKMEYEFSPRLLRITGMPIVMNFGPNCVHIDVFNVF